MTVSIRKADVVDVTSVARDVNLTFSESAIMTLCLKMSSAVWIGRVDGKVACIWGLVPQSLISGRAYLWMYTTDLVEQHKFLLVRHSQIMIKKMLEEFDVLCGHATPGNDRSIKWLRWLGAEFGIPEGGKVPFWIRKK